MKFSDRERGAQFAHGFAQCIKRRCKSWFSLTPEVERACVKQCQSGNTEFTKDDFLCKSGSVDEPAFILAYGYDPCPNSGYDVLDVLDPGDTAGDEQRDFDRYKDVLVVGAAIVVLAIISMIVILRK